MKMYKGFDKNMRCRGYQFEVGKTYEEGHAKLCNSGFHACENPFDVWSYYSITNSRFAEVELDGLSEERHNNSKRCGKKIKIKKEIGISGIVKAAVETILDSVEECKDELASDNGGNVAKIGSSGNFAQIGSSGGYAKMASSGDVAKIGSSGNDAKIASSGYAAHIGSSGGYAKIGSSGDCAKIGSSGDSAEVGSSGDVAKIGSSGNYAKVGSCGDLAKIGSSGDCAKISSSGNCAVIAAIGVNSAVKAKKGSWITLAEYDNHNEPVCVKTEQVDGEKIKADTDYILVGGVFEEVTK